MHTLCEQTPRSSARMHSGCNATGNGRNTVSKYTISTATVEVACSSSAPLYVTRFLGYGGVSNGRAQDKQSIPTLAWWRRRQRFRGLDLVQGCWVWLTQHSQQGRVSYDMILGRHGRASVSQKYAAKVSSKNKHHSANMPSSATNRMLHSLFSRRWLENLSVALPYIVKLK